MGRTVRLCTGSALHSVQAHPTPFAAVGVHIVLVLFSLRLSSAPRRSGPLLGARSCSQQRVDFRAPLGAPAEGWWGRNQPPNEPQHRSRDEEGGWAHRRRATTAALLVAVASGRLIDLTTLL